ncbi:MAG: lipoprotein signal peptidase [Gammaproteobacteria bacterium]|nr:lipoprotein signal peptidase [Gammaproteobacteria bacterium]
MAPRGYAAATPWYLFAIALVAIDQLSKYLVQANFELYERLPLLPLLDFTLVYNEGAAWSFLSDAGGWQRWLFTAISSVVSVVLVIWIARTAVNETLLCFALAAILGGAVGNLIDRVMLGKVVDFVLVYYKDWYFPAFNVADAAITVGAAAMLLDIFVGGEKSGQQTGAV